MQWGLTKKPKLKVNVWNIQAKKYSRWKLLIICFNSRVTSIIKHFSNYFSRGFAVRQFKQLFWTRANIKVKIWEAFDLKRCVYNFYCSSKKSKTTFFQITLYKYKPLFIGISLELIVRFNRRSPNHVAAAAGNENPQFTPLDQNQPIRNQNRRLDARRLEGHHISR